MSAHAHMKIKSTGGVTVWSPDEHINYWQLSAFGALLRIFGYSEDRKAWDGRVATWSLPRGSCAWEWRLGGGVSGIGRHGRLCCWYTGIFGTEELA